MPDLLPAWSKMILVAAIAGTAAVAGYFAGRNSVEIPPAHSFTFQEGRAGTALRRAPQFGKADTLIIGDSLIEQTILTDSCGKTFEAGIGGVRSKEALAVLPRLVSILDPDTVVIAVGTNFFGSGDEYNDLIREYPELVNAAGDRRIILVGIAISERGNAYIRDFAATNGHAYVEPPRGPFFPDEVHYNTEGSLAYREAISAACARNS